MIATPSPPTMASLGTDWKVFKACISPTLARWAHNATAGILLAWSAELELADRRFVV